jgi:hypothetical protein
VRSLPQQACTPLGGIDAYQNHGVFDLIERNRQSIEGQETNALGQVANLPESAADWQSAFLT